MDTILVFVNANTGNVEAFKDMIAFEKLYPKDKYDTSTHNGYGNRIVNRIEKTGRRSLGYLQEAHLNY